MVRPLSIGAKWTLRYTLFTSIVLCGFAYLLYFEFRELVLRDATLVLRLQFKELAEEIDDHPGDLEDLREYVDAHVSSAADLKLGIRILDANGAMILEQGAPAGFPLPAVLPAVGSQPELERLDLGEKYPYYTGVIPAGGNFVQVVFYGRLFERSAKDMLDLFFLALPPMILATSLFGWWLVRGMLRPIAQIDEAARRISALRLDERIALSGSGDELDRLALTLNDMSERLNTGVGRIRRFASSAAHELRAPISRLRNRIEDALSRDREAGADEKLLVETLADVDGVAAILRALLDLAHSEGGLDSHQVRVVDLTALLEGVADFFDLTAETRGVKIERRFQPGLQVRGESSWLRQLFANLVDNAIKFSDPGGRVEIEAGIEADAVRVSVHDYGRGVPAADRERIFEPFHRAVPSGGPPGAGLGLALVQQIAAALGGRVEIESVEGQGATFSVWLPRLA